MKTLKKILMVAFFSGVTLSVKATGVTVTEASDVEKISTYLSSLYSPNSEHNLLINEQDVSFSEWVYNSLVAKGDDCTLGSGCSYVGDVGSDLDLIETLDDALGKLYNFQRDKGYTTYTSYSSWKAASFHGRSNAQIIELVDSSIDSLNFIDAGLESKIIHIKFPKSDDLGSYTNTTDIQYNPVSGAITLTDANYHSDFKYTSEISYDPANDYYSFTVQDYTCSGTENKCVQDDGISSPDLFLHTDITITVDSSSGKILSVSGKLHNYGDLSSTWEGQDDVNTVLTNAGGNAANGDYLDLSTISIDWNL